MADPTIFERCFAYLMVHEVDADPLDPAAWSGGAVGAGSFQAANGGLDMSRADKGNWTGGAVDRGTLGGTRWGISTAAFHDDLHALAPAVWATFPDLVKDLTLDQARVLTRAAYWDRIQGDALPPRVALIVHDAAFNNGVGTAVRWLQTAVGANVDGLIGPGTLAAVQRAVARGEAAAVAAEVLAERINAMARMPSWVAEGFGWSRRLARLAFQAAELPAS